MIVSYFEDQNLSRIRLDVFSAVPRKHGSALIEGIEEMTEPISRSSCVARRPGCSPIDLVRSGLEDTMRNSYQVISDV